MGARPLISRNQAATCSAAPFQGYTLSLRYLTASHAGPRSILACVKAKMEKLLHAAVPSPL